MDIVYVALISHQVALVLNPLNIEVGRALIFSLRSISSFRSIDL